MNRKILHLAVPNIVSNITVPLLGMVDLAIVGHLGGGSYLGGVAIGTSMFNLLYWNFGFLRMGTSGFTSQAYGRRDFGDAFRTLLRAMIIAAVISLLILALQVPLSRGILGLMNGSAEVELMAHRYFMIRVWAAPATLSLYALNGWFIGMQNARTPMYIAIISNVIHIIGSLFFAVFMDMGIEGVAIGTVVAQWLGLLLALGVVLKYYARLFHRDYLKGIINRTEIAKFMNVNSDIFLRTVCLVIVFTFFTSASSSYGDTVLAANALILQMFTLFSYIMDGFAYSGEALAGRYFGAGNMKLLRQTTRLLFGWGAAIALIFTLIYALWGEEILRIFSDDPQVIVTTRRFAVWATLFPVVGFTAFLMDGVLVGMSQAKIMRNTMVLSMAAFFVIYYGLRSTMGNDALWLAFVIFLGLRGVLQLLSARKIFRS